MNFQCVCKSSKVSRGRSPTNTTGYIVPYIVPYYDSSLYQAIILEGYNSLCVSRSVVLDSLQPHGLQPARLFCPWDSPGKKTGVYSHSFLQGIFLTPGSNPSLLHYRQILYHLSHQESPQVTMNIHQKKKKKDTSSYAKKKKRCKVVIFLWQIVETSNLRFINN